MDSSGNTVILPIGNSEKGKPPDIELKRQSRTAFAKALAISGLGEAERDLRARQCSCSITVYQRRNPSATYIPPDWASQRKIASLIPAILAEGWDGNNVNDKAIIEKLSGKKYDEFIREIQGLTRVDDAPLIRAGSFFALSAPVDAFVLAKNIDMITTDDLGRFHQCVLDIFKEIAPITGEGEGEKAQLFERKELHSNWLRDGMAPHLSKITFSEH